MFTRILSTLRRYGLVLPLAILAFIIVGGLVYWIAFQGVGRSGVRTVPGSVLVTSVPPLPGTPVAPFAQIDPAIVAYLQSGQPSYGVVPLDALGPEVPPVGAYLPRSGNTQFSFAEPTPLPTPLPYPTSPPLPIPAVPQQILPTVSPLEPDGTPRTLPYASDGCAPASLPVDGLLTQRFHVYHSGIDIGVPLGTPIIATHSGIVTYADWSTVGYGYLIILQNNVFITYYAHQTSFNVSVGQQVGKGSIIGWSGSTGNSTGPHVHYETRINDVPVDPLSFEERGYGSC
jgi:murein DD-endopeptidase MepM/ murein hydrolase activator NlpD